MFKTKLAGGVVHTLPNDFRAALNDSLPARTAWQDITPLARNEWICWVESAKQTETRERRIKIGCDKLTKGMRRPCCWVGCMHRARNGS